MKEETKEWLELAERDLKAAKYNFEGGQYEISAFLCQQSAEKALKAVYIKKHGRLLKVHDLVLLCKEVGAPEQIIEICKEVTNFYVETRYPGSRAKFEKEIVSSALQKTGMVVEWSKENL